MEKSNICRRVNKFKRRGDVQVVSKNRIKADQVEKEE